MGARDCAIDLTAIVIVKMALLFEGLQMTLLQTLSYGGSYFECIFST